jgi:tetratricopeptide (TPR) repeat protein
MPRPSKHVSPDTLGGRIRAAREHLQLSLAEVAAGQYSTSLISQIERNRVEPSEESLRFLADRLQLSFEDLEILAQQNRTLDGEMRQFKSYDDLRVKASQLFAQKEYTKALHLLKDLPFPQISATQRWRLAVLRGQCFYEQRKFLKAQRDFMYAASEHPRPEGLPVEQRQELMLLHLHLAGTYRELQQFDEALDQYAFTLRMVNRDTPFGYAAEAHWGMSLIAFAQSHNMGRELPSQSPPSFWRETKLHVALEHAENARFLYRAIGEPLRAAAVTCHIAQIEQASGRIEQVRTALEEVLSAWSYTLEEPAATTPEEKHHQQEAANVVSAAACALAGIELEAHNYEAACDYVERALQAGRKSYKIRRANAYLMQGRIFEAIDPTHPQAEAAFRRATQELADTHRIAARISAHVRLGRHLLKIGKIEESEHELDQARLLSDLVSASGPSNPEEDIPVI